jgi:hypothetical protein
MDIIRNAIAEVKRRINRHILDRAFVQREFTYRFTNQSNVDDQILTMVIRPRVLVDCNIVGGITAMIPLDGLAVDKPNNFTTIIHIPKTRTMNKSIMSVSNVNYYDLGISGLYAGATGYGYNSTIDSGENTAAMNAAMGIMASLDRIPITSTSDATLVAENTIMIKDMISMPPSAVLRCVLQNDEGLNNIQPRSYHDFFQLVEFAVKAYIYNELIVDIDMGELQGGQQLGIFKQIVEGYADAEQNYQDKLKSWMAISVMNDTPAFHRYLKLSVGANR